MKKGGDEGEVDLDARKVKGRKKKDQITKMVGLCRGGEVITKMVGGGGRAAQPGLGD